MNTEIHEEAWLAWRRGDDLPDGETAVTASTVAAAATGKYGGMYAAVAKRLGLLENDIDPALAARGHKWEDAIAQMVHLGTGLHVVGEQAWAENPEHSWMRATTDGFLSPVDPAGIDDLTGVLEIKTRTALATGPQPWDYWNAQIQWQMLVTGLPRAVLAVAYINDVTGCLTGLKLHDIDADYSHQVQLEQFAQDYRWHYANNSLPIREDADLEHVKAVGPAEYSEDDVALDSVNLDGDGESWDYLLEVYLSVKAAEKTAEKNRKQIEARILQAMRSIEATSGATETGWKVKLGDPALIVTDEAKAELMASHPEMAEMAFVGSARAKEIDKAAYNAARKPLGARKLTVTPPKEQK